MDNVAKFFPIHWIERGGTPSMKEYNNLKHNFALSIITAEIKNKSWIVFEYLINIFQNEKENILKSRKFILFIYLLHHWLIRFSKFRQPIPGMAWKQSLFPKILLCLQTLECLLWFPMFIYIFSSKQTLFSSNSRNCPTEFRKFWFVYKHWSVYYGFQCLFTFFSSKQTLFPSNSRNWQTKFRKFCFVCKHWSVYYGFQC